MTSAERELFEISNALKGIRFELHNMAESLKSLNSKLSAIENRKEVKYDGK